MTESIRIAAGRAQLDGDLAIPDQSARGIVLFAHGSGSSRFSSRNRFVADQLLSAGLATLLIVGGDDEPVIGMNQEAMRQMRCEVKLEIVEGATHLFEEPGTLEQVARLARDWFIGHLHEGTPKLVTDGIIL